MPNQSAGQSKERAERCLLKDSFNVRASPRKLSSHGQQERAASRQHHALAGDGKPAFHQSLQPARTHHPGERPSRKGKKDFSSACGQNQAFIVQVTPGVFAFYPQRSGSSLRNDAGAVSNLHLRMAKSLDASLKFLTVTQRVPVLLERPTPYLATRRLVIVQEAHTASSFGSRRGC